MLSADILEKVAEVSDPLFHILDASRPKANCVLKVWFHIFSERGILAQIILKKSFQRQFPEYLQNFDYFQ